MKHQIQILFTLLLLCGCATLHAQESQEKYLSGAVPEVDGKVVFTREFSIPGMTQQEIYKRVLGWMDARLKKNENSSRVVLPDEPKGQIVGLGDEWIVFSSSALALDRTRILYQLNAICQPERCVLNVEKVRYIYREGKEKYTAEEWISDKYALNKSKTKLVRGLAKWRRKTVDFVDGLSQELADALSAAGEQTADKNEQPEVQEEPQRQTGPIVIAPKKTVIATPQEEKPAVAAVAPVAGTKPAVDVAPAVTDGAQPGYQAVAPDALPADAIRMGSGRLVIVIGKDAFNMTTMTANAGGSLGKVSGKPVVFTLLAPDQPYEQLEQAETYVVRFYPTGQAEPSVILECRKLPSQEPLEGQPRMYIGEIVQAFTK